jgi:hypothetical protein
MPLSKNNINNGKIGKLYNNTIFNTDISCGICLIFLILIRIKYKCINIPILTKTIKAILNQNRFED